MPPTTRKRPSTAAAIPEQKDLSDDDENDVDEPDELKDVSEDEWTPDPSQKGKKATPSRRGPQSKKKKVSFDEDDSDEGASKKKTPAKSKAKGKPAKTNGKAVSEDSAEDSEEDEDEEEDSEGDGEADFEGADAATEKEFPPGSFVVLKTQFDTMDEPPIWRIDGKTLLQKYLPHKDDEDKDESNLYISTSSFNFWNHKVKDKYYPATVKYKQQKGTDRIVEFQRDLVKNNNGDNDVSASE